ncbi:MAG: hypothetical protein L0332_30810 [Chloroflexi bacterium]|nr:hypothetical protein [Chloroflexota bacterium]MCI0731091.1 hypothetical protein [Chloroflexota bacterium]
MKPPIVTVESCLSEARLMVKYLRQPPKSKRRLVRIFTKLARDDATIGRLAHYFWWRQILRHRPA